MDPSTIPSVQSFVVESDLKPEDDVMFWSEGVYTIGDAILVKQFANSDIDNVHIMRINKLYGASKFKFSSNEIPELVKKINEVVDKVVLGEDKKWKLAGCEKISSWEYMLTDDFWSGDYIKVEQFRIKPFLTEKDTLQFRLWQELDTEEPVIVKNKDGTSRIWRGSVATIGVSELKKLSAILEKLKRSPVTT